MALYKDHRINQHKRSLSENNLLQEAGKESEQLNFTGGVKQANKKDEPQETGTQESDIESVSDQITEGIHEQNLYKEMRGELFKYEAADWMAPMTKIPKYRIKLALTNTPIHRWNLPGIPEKFKIFIKRDDLTGSTLSGNKVRKLDFLFAEAVAQGYKHVITGGEVQSNHCRSVAIAARELGMRPHLILRSCRPERNHIKFGGNMLLNGLLGCKIYFVQKEAGFPVKLEPRIDKLKQHIESTTGEKCYVIPVGGSDEVGVFGYIEAFREMIDQGVCERFDDVVVATCGLGNTLAGIAIGNYLTGSHLRCHGICVSRSRDNIIPSVNEVLTQLGLHDVEAENIVNIINGYHGDGYGLSTPEELDYIRYVCSETGIVLDPVYTGKTTLGLVQVLNKTPEIFKGKRILFMHTGGIFIVTDGRLTDMLNSSEPVLQQLVAWPNEDDLPSDIS
ncbi:uncharacterized protein LOC126831436 isoform X1 [Patella vulgata]|uniref:uncharacterized protein LOC126831436 isoform X1 n=1 Tax=Patella vulgata TaxID=6465 RepID=UPI00217FCA63|nr:uncharacterized protein LOC126831436 isoform X1 [Patella vulgata]